MGYRLYKRSQYKVALITANSPPIRVMPRPVLPHPTRGYQLSQPSQGNPYHMSECGNVIGWKPLRQNCGVFILRIAIDLLTAPRIRPSLCSIFIGWKIQTELAATEETLRMMLNPGADDDPEMKEGYQTKLPSLVMATAEYPFPTCVFVARFRDRKLTSWQ